MAGLKTYEVEVNGFSTSVRLSDADAKARGLTSTPAAKPAAKAAEAPATKDVPAAPRNKSRSAASDK